MSFFEDFPRVIDSQFSANWVIIADCLLFGATKMSDIIRLSPFAVKRLGFFLMALFFVFGGVIWGVSWLIESSSQQKLPVYHELGSIDFQLPSTALQDIKSVDDSKHGLEQFRGQVILLMFGFTHCPEVCPMMLQKMVNLRASLENPSQIQFVFISVDAERDTLDRMRRFFEPLNADIVGFTGSDQELKKVAKDFAATFITGRSGISHTERLYLLDQGGQVRQIYGSSDSHADILTGVQLLLKNI